MNTRYRETLEYLFAQLPMFQRIGQAAYKKDLTNISALCQHLGNPQLRFPCIHVAGTNGKGSVSNMLAAVFSASGYKTGLYTSPHYRDFRERVRIDGKPIPARDVSRFVDNHRPAFDRIGPSFFEWTTALAFDHFARRQVDIAIIETGLGGRFDSTNIVQPLLSVITNISFDHMNILGDTLPQIASEKAGIIKPGIPVVVGESHPETQAVFLSAARRCQSRLFFADQSVRVLPGPRNGQHALYTIQQDDPPMEQSISLEHLGEYQQYNLATVWKALSVFAEGCTKLPSPRRPLRIPEGLARLRSLTGFIGRWELLQENPRIICDSAHNEAGIRQVLSALANMHYQRLHIVFGTVSDKDPDNMLRLLPETATYYFAKAKVPRGLDAQELQQQARRLGRVGKSYASVRTALASARRKAAPDDLIFVGGSIFVVAEVI
jgi:dihydrofolate synthase/folylpolyglutamate synthase